MMYGIDLLHQVVSLLSHCKNHTIVKELTEKWGNNMHKKEMSCKGSKMPKGMKHDKKKKHKSMKNSREELHEAAKHMKMHGG